MATATPTNTKAAVIREEDLDEMQELQKDLQSKIDQAHDDGRVYIMGQYVRIQALVKNEVKKIRNRFDREITASNRKAVKKLKEAQKEDGGEDEDEE